MNPHLCFGAVFNVLTILRQTPSSHFCGGSPGDLPDGHHVAIPDSVWVGP